MFEGSSGKIFTSCMTTSVRSSPQSHEELENAVKNCRRLSPIGDCSTDAHGPMGGWDVSAVTDMHSIFSFAYAFNADITKWDVSAVTNMNRMFSFATAFNADISKWDVSAVTDMSRMFYEAGAFNADISNWDVSAVTDMNNMFVKSSSFDQVGGRVGYGIRVRQDFRDTH